MQALVTGASSGIGTAIAEALAPAFQVLLGGRDPAVLDELAARIPGAVAWPVDLTDDEALAAAAGSVTSLDVLVHSAGFCEIGPVAQTDAASFRSHLDINVVAAVELTRVLLPALRAAQGHVVFLNSGQGRNPSPGWSAYAASKFAVRAYADVLRAEEPALRVTSVYPGRTDTPMQRAVQAAEGRDYDPTGLIRPQSVASVVLAAVTAAPNAHLTEVIVRPQDR